ncbi:MAG: WD40 repeat domain-containing protein [Actinomadura sp.]
MSVDAGCATATLTHTDWVTSVAFSPDGKTLATGSYGKIVRLWDVASGGAAATFDGRSDWVYSVAFSTDGRILATGGNDNTARLWKIK